MNSDSIAIVGMACRFPDADNLDSFWDNIERKHQSFRAIPESRWDAEQFWSKRSRDVDRTYAKRGAFLDDIKEFPALHYGISPRRVSHMDPQQRLLLELTRSTLQDAGYENGSLDSSRAGTFVGVSTSEFRNFVTVRNLSMWLAEGGLGSAGLDARTYSALSQALENTAPINAFSMPGTLLNMVAANVAYQFGFGGPAYSVDAACASALVAVQNAVESLRSGTCDVAFAGGVYLSLTPLNYVSFSRIGAMSRSGDCRPFDEKADGFLQGEGAGLLLLKRLDDAQRDGDRIHAVIRGVGINNDAGRSSGPMAPSLEGQAGVLRDACKDAGVDPHRIQFVEAHGTATPVGDPVEAHALRDVMGAGRSDSLYVSSVKGNIGHAMSAAGAAGLIKAVLALRNEVIPPQAGYEAPHAALELADGPLSIPTEATPWESNGPRLAGVSSFGFGGTNCHIVVEQAPEPPSKEDAPYTLNTEGATELVVLSAPSRPSLARHAREVRDALRSGKLLANASLSDVALSLGGTRKLEAMRLAIVATDRGQLAAELEEALGKLESEDELELELSPNARVSTAPVEEAPRFVFMFPGQGAQRLQLLRGLYERHPAFREKLEALSKTLDALLPRPLLSYLYPDRDMSEEETKKAELALQATEICQPAMAALGLALAQFLGELGITPSACVGHSLGEFVAAAAGGMLSAEDALTFVARRGRIMADLSLEDPGAMAAAMGDAANIRKHTAGIDGVDVANMNHPRQTVISGSTEGVEKAIAALKGGGVAAKRLRVSHAFHSQLMQPAARAIEPLVDELPLSSPSVPVVSAIRSNSYDDDTSQSRKTLCTHATAPVDYVGALLRCAELGDVFVQVGAGNTLTVFANQTLGKSVPAIVCAATKPDGERRWNLALAEMVARGGATNLRALYTAAHVESAPVTPLDTQPYWPENTRAMPLNHELGRASSAGKQQQGVPVPSVVRTSAPAVSPTNAEGGDNEQSKADMIALFREQTALLNQHAAIIAQQAAALNGAPPPAPGPESQPLTVPTQEAPPAVQAVESAQPTTVSESVSESPAPVEDDHLQNMLLTAITDVSAFPRDALNMSQSLANDLGFDSLMFVDLSSKLQASLPGLTGVPQTLLSEQTTVGDILAHLRNELHAPAENTAAEASAETAPVSRYQPVLAIRPRSERAVCPLAISGWTLVTMDEAGVGESLAENLVGEGQRVALVQLGEPFEGVVRMDERTVCLAWPNDPDSISKLFDELGREGIDLTAIVHAAGLDTRGPLSAPANDDHAFPHVVPLATALAAALAKSTGGNPDAFISVTGLGGHLGMEPSATTHDAIWQTALLGFTKSLAREWPNALVKAVDIHPSEDAADVATQILEEMMAAEQDVEVGLKGEERSVVALELADLPEANPAITCDSVVLVTGGARGLGAKIAIDLANRTKCKLVIVGSRELGSTDTEAVSNLTEMRQAGSEVEYVRWDVRDAMVAARVLDEARTKLGAITTVIHAAGVIRDRKVTEKTAEDIDQVIGVKIRGLLNVFRAVEQDPVSWFVSFSSWSARYGNIGQTDYAAANDLMGRLTAQLAEERQSRGTSIDWPIWSDSAMGRTIPDAVRTALVAEGVTFLSDDEGLGLFAAEAENPQSHGEILFGREIPLEDRRARVWRDVSTDSHPFLKDHTIKGRPVLPMASALDMMASLAKNVAGAASPITLRDVRLYAGVDVSKPQRVFTQARVRDYGDATRPVVNLEVRSKAVEGSAAGLPPLAYSARIEGDTSIPKPVVPEVPGGESSELSPSDYYSQTGIHGPIVQGIDKVDEIGRTHLLGWVKLSDPKTWIRDPKFKDWTIDPGTVDGALQLVMYWLWTERSKLGIPTELEEYVQYEPFASAKDERVHCTLVLQDEQGGHPRGDVWFSDSDGKVLAAIRMLHSQTFAHPDGAKAPTKAAPAPQPPTAPPSQSAGNGSSNGERPKRSLDEIDASLYEIGSFPEVEALTQRFQMAELIGIRNPYFHVHEGVARDTSQVEGKEMLNFSSYNYLGMSGFEAVSRAAKEAIDTYGTSVSASRVASGERPLHAALEEAISDLTGTESALVFSSGHHTNETVIGHMFGPGDLILHDSLAHNSVLQGAALSGAKRMAFPHNDWEALERMLGQLRTSFDKVLIAIEGVYSMDGDIPDLPKFIELRNKYKCLLFVDEAHSIGVLGHNGGGISQHFGTDPHAVDIWMGTLSKSFASCGGYVAGRKVLTEYLKYTAPGFVFSAGISPANAAAALASVTYFKAHPELVKQLQDNGALFLKLLQDRDIDTGLSADSAVVPCIVGNSLMCLQLSQKLGERGINVQPIVYPAVDDDAARLRFFISATHTPEQLERTADILAEELGALRAEAMRKEGTPPEQRAIN